MNNTIRYNTYVAVPWKLPKIWRPFFWDQNVLLIIILQLYDDIMIFQYKTTTLKHNRTWTTTPSPNGLGGHIKVGQETPEGCSKVRNDFMDSYIRGYKGGWGGLRGSKRGWGEPRGAYGLTKGVSLSWGPHGSKVHSLTQFVTRVRTYVRAQSTILLSNLCYFTPWIRANISLSQEN